MSGDEGTIIAGKYRLLELAGEGGMASVWRAITLGAAGFIRPVAVKRILPHLEGDPHFIAMFVEEARVGAELSHPNIVQIHDFGVDEEGLHFLVMEWVEGLDLGRYIESFAEAGMRTPWPYVAAIAIEVLRALGAAHERCDLYGNPAPVFHRDVTPHNVLCGTNGIVKLTDFGLARAMDRARMTQPDVLKGKLAYLAPELTHGHAPGERTDLFSVGVCLWEALVGEKLFQGATDVEVFRRVRDADIPPIADYRSDIPPSMLSVAHRALAPVPEQRYRSCREMARAIANVLRSVPEATDAHPLGRSVVAARERLGLPARVSFTDFEGGRPAKPSDSVDDDPVFELEHPSTEATIPLLHKKR